MARRGLLDKFRDIIEQVKDENEKDENVQTADKSIFDTLKKKIETVIAGNKDDDEETIKRKVNKEVEKAQKENEDDPNQETAPKSVFDRLKDLVMNKKNEANTATPDPKTDTEMEAESEDDDDSYDDDDDDEDEDEDDDDEDEGDDDEDKRKDREERVRERQKRQEERMRERHKREEERLRERNKREEERMRERNKREREHGKKHKD